MMCGRYELIDTQWDVNLSKWTKANIFDTELIDTQWDVNQAHKVAKIGYLRINRYIVGCKYRKLHKVLLMQFELIDTQWDVNKQGFYTLLQKLKELIDTQWDVNFLII